MKDWNTGDTRKEREKKVVFLMKKLEKDWGGGRGGECVGGPML